MLEWVLSQEREVLAWIDQNRQWLLYSVAVAVCAVALFFIWRKLRRGKRGRTGSRIEANIHVGGDYIVADVPNSSAIAIGRGAKVIVENLMRGSPSDEAREQRRRQMILNEVKNTWVKPVLDGSLYNELLIDLGLKRRSGNTSVSSSVIW